MSSSGFATQVCDTGTPLLRADVTGLDSLSEAPPRQELREVQRLGQDIRQLRRSRDADKLHVAILDDLMSKVFPDVNVLGALPAADDIVPPFDTCRVVLVHRGRLRLRKTHTLEEVAKVEYLRSRRGRRVVFRFGRR